MDNDKSRINASIQNVSMDMIQNVSMDSYKTYPKLEKKEDLKEVERTKTDSLPLYTPLPNNDEELMQELKTKVMKAYDMKSLPPFFDKLIEERNIPVNHLLKFWPEVFEKLNARIKQSGRANLQGIDKIKYDLKIVIDEYPAFLEEEKGAEIERKHAQREMVQIIQEQKQNEEFLKHFNNRPRPKKIKSEYSDNEELFKELDKTIEDY